MICTHHLLSLTIVSTLAVVAIGCQGDAVNSEFDEAPSPDMTSPEPASEPDVAAQPDAEPQPDMTPEFDLCEACEQDPSNAIVELKAVNGDPTQVLTRMLVRDCGAGVADVRIAPLDEDGQVMHIREWNNLREVRDAGACAVQVWADLAWTGSTAVTQVEARVFDEGGESSEGVTAIVGERSEVSEGSPCDTFEVENVCAPDTLCSEGGVCLASSAPTVESAEFFFNPQTGGLAWRITGADINADASPFHRITALGPDDVPIETLEVYSGGLTQSEGRFVSEGTAILRAWVGAAISSLRLTVTDLAGGSSPALSVAPSAPQLMEAQQPCDPTGARSVCPEETICTGGGMPLCQAPATQCEGFEATAWPQDGEGLIGDEDHGAASCGGQGVADDVYALELEPGRWEVSVDVDGAYLPVLYARRYCSQDGRWSELACNTRADFQEGMAAIDIEVQQTETVYIFVDGMPGIPDRPSSYTLNVTPRD